MVPPAFDSDFGTLPPPEGLSLKNDFAALETLTIWIADLAQKHGFSKKLCFELELVLAEAITNIIENGYGDGDEHAIDLVLRQRPGEVRVEIIDDGVPFNPLQHPEAVLPDSLENAVEGGLGIHLIRSYTQDCAYRRQGDKNILSLCLQPDDGPGSLPSSGDTPGGQ